LKAQHPNSSLDPPLSLSHTASVRPMPSSMDEMKWRVRQVQQREPPKEKGCWST
jgi:hypothetical protein